jgi:hypothetical protein
MLADTNALHALLGLQLSRSLGCCPEVNCPIRMFADRLDQLLLVASTELVYQFHVFEDHKFGHSLQQ